MRIPGSSDIILDADRDTVQRPAILSTHQRRLLLFRLAHGLLMQDSNKPIQVGLQSVCLRQGSGGDLDGRYFPGFDLWRQLGYGECDEFRGCH